MFIKSYEAMKDDEDLLNEYERIGVLNETN